MVINLNNLKAALKHLEDLPNAEIVKKHPDTHSLVLFLQDETHMAQMILTGTIDLIEEKATLKFLINREED